MRHPDHRPRAADGRAAQISAHAPRSRARVPRDRRRAADGPGSSASRTSSCPGSSRTTPACAASSSRSAAMPTSAIASTSGSSMELRLQPCLGALMQFNAIVLAADRGRNDPVAAAAGVAAKCLTPIAGTPMVVRVVRALEQSGRVEPHPALRPRRGSAARIRPSLHGLVADGDVRWMGRRPPPATSAAAALATLPSDDAGAVTTGDHALLDAEMVRHFLAAARARGGDVAVALAPHDLVREAYPQHAAHRAQVQRWSLLRLQSLRFSHASRPRDGDALATGGGRPQEAHPGHRLRRLGARWRATRSAC